MALRDLDIIIGFKNREAVNKLRETDGEVNKVTRSSVKMGEAFQKAGRKMTRMGGYMTARVTLPIIGVAGAMVKAASDFEELESKFNTVFGEMAAGTRAWAEETSGSINRSSAELMRYLADSQNMLVGMGATRQEATALSKDITMLAVDLASFNNVAESDAISSLQSAMIGNHEAAKSLGAVISENTLAMAMERMQITGKFQDLDELQKMQVRYTAVVLQSEDAIGDAERTSGSFANQMRGLRADLHDVSIEIGTILLPYATELVAWGREQVEVFADMDQGTQENIIQLAGLAAAIGPVLLVGGGLINSLFAFAKMAGLAKWGIGLLVGTIGLAPTIILGLGVAIMALTSDFEKFKETVMAAWEWLGKFAERAGKRIMGGGIDTGITTAADRATGRIAPDTVQQDMYAVSNNSSTFAPNTSINVSVGPTVSSAGEIGSEVKRQITNVLDEQYRRSLTRAGVGTVR